MSAKSHPGQCQETPHPLRSRCPHSYAWASGSWLVRVAARQGAPTGPRPEPAPPSCPGLGVDSCVCHRTCWTSFSSGRGSPTLAFILTVGSNKLRCPGTLELIKPATETCRKLEPKLKERRKRRQPLSAGVRTGQLILWKASEVGTPNLQPPSESGLGWEWTLNTTLVSGAPFEVTVLTFPQAAPVLDSFRP